MRSGSGDRKKQDKGSLWLIWITIAVSIFAALFIAANTYALISNAKFLPYTGILIIVSGMFLRFFAIRSLGKFFTVDITIREKHELKTDGLYKLLRHPSYSGSLISFMGFGLSLNNWLSLLTVTSFIFAAFAYRIAKEEEMLLDTFGQKYTDYSKNTFRLIPWIY